MKRWLTFLIVGALVSGCATTPGDPWSKIEVPRETAQQPLELPKWPDPIASTQSTATFTLEQIVALDAFKEVSEANTAIAREHAAQIDAQSRAVGHLVEAGKATQTLADMRERILIEERRQHAIQKVGLYLLLILTTGAAVQ